MALNKGTYQMTLTRNKRTVDLNPGEKTKFFFPTNVLKIIKPGTTGTRFSLL
jgi:hypothetical protein